MTLVEGMPGFFRIPAGAIPSPCRYCGETIYWITHKGKPSKQNPQGKNSLLPICLEPVGAVAPTATKDGRGINHHADCTKIPQKHREEEVLD